MTRNLSSTLKQATHVSQVCYCYYILRVLFCQFIDVLGLADGKCSGRQECEVLVPDPDFGRLNICDEDLKVYFEASYTCTEVK